MKTFISQFEGPGGVLKWMTYFAPDAEFAREHAEYVAREEGFKALVVAVVPRTKVVPALIGYFKASKDALLQ